MADTADFTNIPITTPGPGQRIEFAVAPGHAYVLDFEPSSALFEKRGDTLHIDFEHGGALHLQHFFSSLQAGGFHLVLPDGVLVDAGDLADALLMPIEEIAPRADVFFPDTPSAMAPDIPPKLSPDLSSGMPPNISRSEALALSDLLAPADAPLPAGEFPSPCAAIVENAAPAGARGTAFFTHTDMGCASDEELLAAYLHIAAL